ncbi:MAG: TetR/AcrR family transcriptional regulator [Nitrospirae bacterium]|nr:TetR/AcrR family transcriptional regulator [Nitrospirota bacterium]
MRKANEHSPTKEKLLEMARQLMQTQGYSATSVDQICEAAGLTKGSFFHYFKSKEKLGKAVLDYYVLSSYQMILEAPFFKKKDPLHRLYGYLDFMVERFKDPANESNCLLGNFAQELSDTHPEIRTRCAGHFTHLAELFKKTLDETKASYAPEARLDTQSLSDHFIAVLEGSILLAKAKQDKGIIEKSLRHFKQYLKTLFEK